MRKSVSMAAAIAIAGGMVFSGCGSSSSGSSSTITAVKGYITDLNGTPVLAECTAGNINSSLTVGAMGKVTFSPALTDDCNVTIQNNAKTEVEINGTKVTKSLAKLGYTNLKTKGNAKVISPLTTLFLGSANFDYIKDIDPQAEASKNPVVLMLTLLAADTNASAIFADMNLSTLADANLTAFEAALPAAVKANAAVVAAKTITEKYVELAAKVDGNTTALDNLYYVLVDRDAGEVLTDDLIIAAVGDANISDINITAASTAASSIVAEEKEEYVPPVETDGTPALALGTGSIQLGDVNLTTSGETNISVATDGSLSDYYTVSIPVNAEAGSGDVNVSVSVTNTEKNATLTIGLMNLAVTSTGSAVTTSLQTGVAGVSVSASNLDVQTGEALFASDVNGTGFDFNISAIASALSNENVTTALGQLNTIFTENNASYTYAITVASDDFNVSTLNGLTGTINVVNGAATSGGAYEVGVDCVNADYPGNTLPLCSTL